MKSLVAAGLSMILVLGAGATALAQADEEAVATISEADGNVTICTVGEECRPAESGDRIFEGTRIRTAATSGRIEVREVPRAEFGEGDQPVILTLADETELWFVPEGYAGENLPEEGVFEVVQGWVRAAIRERKLSATDLAIRKLGRFWQTGTGASCGPKGTDYVISHDPETGITTVIVGEGSVACVMPGGDEQVIGLLERMELGPDGAGSVSGISAEGWLDELRSGGSFIGSGSAEFVGVATQIDRANDPDSAECSGEIPIRAFVSWNAEKTYVEINYHRFNIMGLPRGFGSGDTTQYLECLQGGRQVSHRGGFETESGTVDAMEGQGTAPELVDVTIGWDPIEGVVSSISGNLVGSDMFNSWELAIALTTRCSGGLGLADFTAANTSESVDARSAFVARDQPASGLILTGCTLDLVSPPDGPLELSLADLPEWARDQLVTVGAAADCQDPPSQVSDGDPMVLVDGLSVARVGDPIDDGSALAVGSATILVNGQPAAVVAAC